jgi:transposase
MQGHQHYREKTLFEFRLPERVPTSNFYRRLKDFLDWEFLYEATEKYYGKCGHQSIDPVVFFKLVLVGYLENIASDRKLIEHCAMRLDILYFLGYNLDEPLPWHSTVSRTRQLLGKEIFEALFEQVLAQCVAKGMVARERQCIDSAFVKANASLDSLEEKQPNGAIPGPGPQLATSENEPEENQQEPSDQESKRRAKLDRSNLEQRTFPRLSTSPTPEPPAALAGNSKAQTG